MRGASSQLIEIKPLNQQYFHWSAISESHSKTSRKVLETGKKRSKSMVGFWEAFYEDRVYPSREELAIA